jgi:hypothetical protein
MERAAVYVVPIRVGGGTRLKIYEAMAMEKPVVSTTIGAEGLPVRDGEEIVIADDAEAFAAAVVRLLTDEGRARALALRGATLVRESFGWGRVAERFAEICGRAVEAHGAAFASAHGAAEQGARGRLGESEESDEGRDHSGGDGGAGRRRGRWRPRLVTRHTSHVTSHRLRRHPLL